jgi:arsenate reductase
MVKLFGILNCDSVKKTRVFLETNKIKVEFIDFKKYEPTVDDINRWTTVFGRLPVNTKGVTYKKFRDQFEKLSAQDKINFIQKNTSMIKRPILENEGRVQAFGFDEEQYKKIIRSL